MKKFAISFMLFLGLASSLFSQDAASIRHEIQANYLMEFDVNGNRYGLQFEFNKPIFQSANEGYRLSAGGLNEFFFKDERDIDGISGNTISNILGTSISNSVYFLKARKLFFTNTLYAGWGYRRTKANYTNEPFNIDRDYERSFNYFAFGAYWKLGYRMKDQLSIQAIGKTDLSRLIDQYEPTIFERPGFMYGLGISYSIK